MAKLPLRKRQLRIIPKDLAVKVECGVHTHS